jgi:hypothetical protein
MMIKLWPTVGANLNVNEDPKWILLVHLLSVLLLIFFFLFKGKQCLTFCGQFKNNFSVAFII